MSVRIRVAVIALSVGCLFALAGRLDWFWGWIYVGLLVAGSSITCLVLWFWNPDLFVRRMRMGKGRKTWDMVFLAVFGASFFLILIVGSLDAGRFRDSWMPASLQWTGVALLIFGQAFATWSLLVDPFFEKTARLHSDDDHQIADHRTF